MGRRCKAGGARKEAVMRRVGGDAVMRCMSEVMAARHKEGSNTVMCASVGWTPANLPFPSLGLKIARLLSRRLPQPQHPVLQQTS